MDKIILLRFEKSLLGLSLKNKAQYYNFDFVSYHFVSILNKFMVY
jgi:hypothetical protein